MLDEAGLNLVVSHTSNEAAVTFHNVDRWIVLVISETDLNMERS